MSSWIFAIALPSVAAALAVAHLWLWRKPRVEAHRGVMALANLRWREFSGLVRHAMRQQRGMQDAQISQDRRSAPGSDFIMLKDDQLVLLSCKHGRAYRIGSVAVDELAANARLAGAKGSILLTVGRVERDGMNAAAQQQVEVIDERKIWPLLRPVVPDEMWSDVVHATRLQAIRHSLIAVLAAVAMGVVITLILNSLEASTPPASPQVTADSPAPVTTPAQDARSAPPVALEDLDGEQLQRLQARLSRALASTPGLKSGVWVTRSTIAVDRTVEDAAAWELICSQIQQHPELRNVRVQLNPILGTDGPVRWRQCTQL